MTYPQAAASRNFHIEDVSDKCLIQNFEKLLLEDK